MAIVYSLICFGGKGGKAVTASNSGGYLLLTARTPTVYLGVRNGLKVYFSGTLPGNIASTSTPYYLRGESFTTATVYDTQAHAIAGGTTGKVAWSSAGASVVVTSGYWYELPAGSGTTGRARYGNSGSERCYDGVIAALAGRAGATATDVEVVEHATQWVDYCNGQVTYAIPAAEVIFTPTVDDAPTDAANGGVIAQVTHNGASIWLPNGYICDQRGSYLGSGATGNMGTVFSGTRHTIDGLSYSSDQTFNYMIGAPAAGLYNTVKNCILACYGSAVSYRVGLYQRQDTLTFVNNRLYGFTGTNSAGVKVYGYDSGNGALIANNTVVNCESGFANENSATSPKGWFYNNISVGNTTNWGTTGTGSMHGVGYNAGLSGEAWGATGRKTIATTDFASFAGYDFRPANSSSPQVDYGVTVVGMAAVDIAGRERPDYNNGGAEAWDIGADEFNHGYTRPEVHTIDFSGLVAGSQVIVFTTGTQTELFRDNSCSTTESYDAAAAGVTVDYTVMKAGYLPLRVTGISLAATSTPIAIVQVADRSYVASSGLTFTTNATFNTSTKIASINAATTGQNWYSFAIEAWIAQSALANVAFPLTVNGPNSVTLGNGWEWRGWATSQTQGTGISNTSLALLSRDGMRYVSAAGVVNAIWAAVLTLDTTAGLQVKYRQATAGSIVSASNTGPMDQLVQVFGTASYGNFDYRDHMVLRAPKPGYSQPQPDLVATYGNLEDQFYVAGLDSVAQWPCTNAAVAGAAFNNSTKTSTFTVDMTAQEAYQAAQYWANQDAQWDSDIPLTSPAGDGNTFTQPDTWTLEGIEHWTDSKTLAGGLLVVVAAPATLSTGFSGLTLQLPGEGTYTFTAANCTVETTPTADNVHYVLSGCTFSGTLTVHNQNAHPIVVEVPSGTTTSSAGNTGGAVTFAAPVTYQSVTVTGFTAGSRIWIKDVTSGNVLCNATASTTNVVISGSSCVWTDPAAASAVRQIALRVHYVSGATAKLLIDRTDIGTCATSGSGKDVSYIASQSADTTYNSNAVIGADVTDITFTDAATDLVVCNLAGGSTTYPRAYAAFVYWMFTATGIDDDVTYIDAPDTANYIFTSMKFRNANAAPLTITGGYGRDATSGLVADIIDVAGSIGNIYPQPDHVVAYQTTGTYAITGDISTVITSIGGVPAAVLSAAQTTPIHSDLKKVLGEVFTGAGTEADPWGP